MKQSRMTSLFKSLVSTAVGFGVAFVANMLILPLFGFEISHSANLLLTTIYTVISIARGYALERVFEALGWRTRMSAFATAVLAERQRQIAEEGWSIAHDDDHVRGELARASASYSMLFAGALPDFVFRTLWPWSRDWFKPKDDPRRNLIVAGAMNLAEGEKFDRSRKLRRVVTDDGSSEHASSIDSKTASYLAHGKTRSQHAGTSESIPPDHG